MEYEDAYVYIDASRALLHDYQWGTDPLSIKSCIDGSVNDCHSEDTFNGHLIVFPLVLSAIHRLFGYSYWSVFIFNFCCNLAVLIVCFKIIQFLTGHDNKSFKLPLLLLATTPFGCVFNTSALAETFSSLLALWGIYYFLIAQKGGFTYKGHTIYTSVAFIAIAILVKRENLILITLPILSLLFESIINRRQVNAKLIRHLPYIITLLVIGFALNYLIGLGNIEGYEAADIGAPTFSLFNFRIIFPKFLLSFVDFPLWGMTGYLFITSSVLIIYKGKSDLRILLTIVWLYIFMYSAHYRSYYQVHSGTVSIFETLRYSSNILPLICLLTVPIANLPIQFYKKTVVFTASIILYLGTILYANYTLRKTLSDREYEERIYPVDKTLQSIGKEDVIITDMPCLFHILENENQCTVSTYSISKNMIENYLKDGRKIYILGRIENGINTIRFKQTFSILKDFRIEDSIRISGDYELSKITSSL